MEVNSTAVNVDRNELNGGIWANMKIDKGACEQEWIERQDLNISENQPQLR